MGTPSVSNVNPIGPNVGSLPTTRVNLLGIDISLLQLASPPPDLLADMSMIYQTPNGSLYQSNGTSLISMNSGTTGAIRVAATTAIPLDTAGNGKAMPLIAGNSYTISSPSTITIAAGQVENGVCVVDFYLTADLTLPVGAAFSGDALVAGFKYRAYFFIAAGDLRIVSSKGAAVVIPAQIPNAATFVPGVITTNSLPFTLTAGAVDATHDAAVSYKVFFKRAVDATYSLFANLNVLSGTITGLTTGTTGTAYNFKVVAMNTGGDAVDSVVVNRTTVAVGTGVLTSSSSVMAASSFDLTAEGAIDWGGFREIGFVLGKIGSATGLTVSRFGAGSSGPAVPHQPMGSFTDSSLLGAGVAGTTTSVNINNQPGMYQNLDANPNGVAVVVNNIGTTQRTVDFYFRSDNSTGTALVTLTLSDGSAVLAPFSVSNTGGTNGVKLRTLVKADVAGSSLTIRVESSTARGLNTLVYGLVVVA